MDYPNETVKGIQDKRVRNYTDFYLSYEKNGAQFIPNYKNNEKMNNELKQIVSALEKPYIYLSIDVDVGAANSILAARFMDFMGIDQQCFLEAAHIIKSAIHSNNIEVIGLDFMEIEVYFLNAVLKNGTADKTLKIIDDVLRIICT